MNVYFFIKMFLSAAVPVMVLCEFNSFLKKIIKFNFGFWFWIHNMAFKNSKLRAGKPLVVENNEIMAGWLILNKLV